jgi:hypothetical protein
MPSNKKGQYQKNLDAASAGANQSGGNPITFAGNLAQGLAAKISQKKGPSQLTNVGDPSLLSYEAAAQQNPHVQAMKQIADAAKLKYMQENGVDENGELVQKK